MISDVYFPRVNGVSTSIQTFLSELRRLGHDTLLIAPEYPGTVVDEPGILRIPARTVPLDPEDRLMRSGPILNRVDELRAARFDLLHIHTPFRAHYCGLELARRLRLPRVETYHTFFEEYLHHYVPVVPKGWMRGLARRFSRTQCNEVDALIVPSSAMLEVLRRYGITVPMEIIPTGVRLDKLAGGNGRAFREKHAIGPDRPTLVHVGRVAFEKNIEFLLRVLVRVRNRIADVLLIIAGEGPALPRLQASVKRLGLQSNVLFIGYLARETELLDCYRAGDAFVFASATETQGLVLLEAMALGVPVIAPAILGTQDILRPARGALVPRLDEAEFTESCVRMLTEPALRQRLSGEAQAYAKEWSAARMAERMAAFYARVCAQAATAAREAVLS
jgi:glycosyltransferase involved in cell wall biosynthesis